MQRYWDLSNQNRADLTREQVDAMLAVELMEKGVAKPVKPELCDVAEITLDKVKYFGVKYAGKYSGLDDTKLVFRTIEQAQALINAKPLRSDYDYNIGDRYRYAIPLDGMVIETVELSTEANVEGLRPKLTKQSADKKANSKALETYKAACLAMQDATQGVWEDWHACLEEKARAEKIFDTLDEYAEICDGDREKAATFLHKAFSANEIAEAFEWFGMEQS
ncbi:MAG: hypothetical protein ABIH03_02585, partial [Pseudomonadota bacterium]